MEASSIHDALSIAIRSDKLWEGVAMYLSTYIRIHIDKVMQHNGIAVISGTVSIPQYDTDMVQGVRIPIEPLEQPFTTNSEELLEAVHPDDKEEFTQRLSVPVPVLGTRGRRGDADYEERYPAVLAYYRDTVKYIYLRAILLHLGALTTEADKALHEYKHRSDTINTINHTSYRPEEGFGL